ncbi:FecCD family ABC transporter permease [Aneurinibacillus aneurinilyticus]|jgi:iron complex transport system permease protein|uniref:Iron ABC transporter permease n=2 Tax=Aneurinibacillus aneurinilyticus TaxID=1391 RepID=A0A848CW76_ANEAE|nr:iron ABC transporter permease [Aneurinibacillus aneurinilyticus]ERI11178.1 iron-uptake system permease protein FeuB [Aneurinibacillus aneurinilyticus ATCC 12856]MCI1695389.1 iron ABC transporter permease [Aneurinibacillus aneurinilyticus]MED0704833.1 iron ABC transporter permease [Aneurinibacillus aneurinilyticus]MED0723843.1 iron ABC transporter permease [Aneurinibacillus aneurinilyticus]MED0731084.1 iron ABC transporter permease [Aneurinibacillus aneurinilyticus]
MRLRISLPVIILCISPLVIILTILVSILYGAKNIDADTVWEAIFSFDPGNVNHQIVMHSRLPRVIGALLIGAFLAISGALMQGMTRNYLASPSIMGVSDGSAFAITFCMIFMPNASSLDMIVYSLIGSAFGVGITFGLASLLPNGMTPVRMAIIGVIIGTFLSSVSAALASYFQVSQNVSFWYNARLHQINPDMIMFVIPFAVVGIAMAFFISRSITVLSLGEEMSISLGQRTLLVKLMATASVVILTGISVALAGKIGFVGLIIPHITRFLVGIDYRRIIPYAGILGGIFLALSDVLSRFLNYPFETPIGVVTSLFGVPFFLYLIRKRGGTKHV